MAVNTKSSMRWPSGGPAVLRQKSEQVDAPQLQRLLSGLAQSIVAPAPLGPSSAYAPRALIRTPLRGYLTPTGKVCTPLASVPAHLAASATPTACAAIHLAPASIPAGAYVPFLDKAPIQTGMSLSHWLLRGSRSKMRQQRGLLRHGSFLLSARRSPRYRRTVQCWDRSGHFETLPSLRSLRRSRLY
jgi:hypothetical protein